MGETALVFFTVFSQLAAGTAITLWLLDTLTGQIEQTFGAAVMRIVLGTAIASAIISVFHLGHPLEAWRALSHIGNSWLSREIVFLTLFTALALLYYRQWITAGEARKVYGALTALAGLLTVLASGMIYVLPALPAWNNLAPVAFFLMSAALLGPLCIAALAQIRKVKVSGHLFTFAAAVMAAGLLGFGIYVTMLAGTGGLAAMTGTKILQSSLFWPRLLLGWALPLSIAAYQAIIHKQNLAAVAVTIFALAVIGEIMGREIFYSTITAIPVGAF